MVVVFDTAHLLGRDHAGLARFRPEYFADWPAFERMAAGATCAIVVVDADEPIGGAEGRGDSGRQPEATASDVGLTDSLEITFGAGPGAGVAGAEERSRRWSASGSRYSRSTAQWPTPPGTADGTIGVTRTRLRALARRLGPAPLVVVSADVFARFVSLGRLPVDAILTRAGLAELEPTITRLLATNARLRLATAIETVDIGLPAELASAFVHALRRHNPVGTCRNLAGPAGVSAAFLRAKLRASPHGRAGRRLHWFVDAARIVRAAEPASRGLDQLSGASILKMSERTLIRSRQRVLGPDSEWKDLRDPVSVANRVWSDLIVTGGST